jgi:LPXTG-site transpeptidase (sortase) family protein
MMYRRKRNSFANLSVLIILGGLAGVIFVIYDNYNHPQAPLVVTQAVTTPTYIPTSISLPTALPVSVPGVVIEAEISIPKMGLFAQVIPVYLAGDSWDVTQLGPNVGHLEGTAWLDKPGNVVLSGHVTLRDGRNGIFAALKDLTVGDSIIIIYKGEERIYGVTETKTVEPDDLTPLYPTTTEVLTLITCDVDAYDFFQNSYQKRIVTVAERTS